jgi:hypothetical protein
MRRQQKLEGRPKVYLGCCGVLSRQVPDAPGLVNVGALSQAPASARLIGKEQVEAP